MTAVMTAELANVARARALVNARAADFEAWHERAVAGIESVMPPDRWERVIEQLEPDERAMLIGIEAHAPTPKHFQLLRDTLRAMGRPGWRELRNEDRRFLAEARGMVLDAQFALETGDLTECLGFASQARDRVKWMVNERKRDGAEVRRQLPSNLRPAFEGLITVLEDMVTLIKQLMEVT
jgi:hypothetical protein